MNTSTATAHTAGVFDIRTIIGALLGIYGLILTLMGLFADQALDKTGGVNANLFAGLALLVVGGIFLAWAKLAPVILIEDPAGSGDAVPVAPDSPREP